MATRCGDGGEGRKISKSSHWARNAVLEQTFGTRQCVLCKIEGLTLSDKWAGWRFGLVKVYQIQEQEQTNANRKQAVCSFCGKTLSRGILNLQICFFALKPYHLAPVQ